MKSIVKLLTAGAVLGFGVLVAVTADAQRPRPLPLDGTASTHHHHVPNPLPRAIYPMSPAHFDLLMGRQLESVRKYSTSSSRYPLPAGDANLIILRTRECISAAESDGVVTAQEGDRCTKIIDIAIKQHEQSHPGR